MPVKKTENLVVTDLRVEYQGFANQMRAAEKLAIKVDKSLADLTKTANKTAKALDKLAQKKIDVTIKADSSSVDRVQGDLDAIDGRSPNVEIQADTTQVDRVMSDLDTLDGKSPKVTIHADDADLETAQRIVASLESATPTVKVNTDDGEIDTTKRKVDDLNTTETVKVTADTSGVDTGLRDVEKKLDDLKGQGRIQIALEIVPTVAGAAGGAVGGLAGTFIDPIIEVERALGGIQARTGQIIPDADKLISDIFGSNMAESRTEVAQWIAQFIQVQGVTEDTAGDIIGIATASDIMGKDFTENLRAVDKLVSTGLVGSVTEANDLLVTAFQQGGDRADDLIDTLVEYPLLFKEMGIDGAGAVNLMLQALEAGSFNTDKLADTFKELGIRVDEAIGSKAGATFDALTNLNKTGVKIDLATLIDTSRVQQLIDDGLIKDGILNPMQLAKLLAAGEISGIEFAEGMTAAANKAVDEGLINEGQATFDLREIFGTPLEDLGTDLFRGLDFGAALAATIDEGATEEAGAALYGSLDQTLQQSGRLIQENILDKLGGVEGILQRVNEKAKEFNTLLQGGADIPEALEIILEMPGLADTLHGFEAALGNFVIDLLSGIADILSGLGQGQAAADVRREVGRLSEQQLSFDLQYAQTEEDMAAAVQRAIQRGVDQTAAEGAVATAVEEMIAAGNAGAALDLVESIEAVPPATLPIDFFEGGERKFIEIPVDVERGALQEDIDKALDEALHNWRESSGFQGQVTEGELQFNPQLDLTGLDETVQTAVQGLANQAREALATGDKLAAIDFFEQAGMDASAKEVAQGMATQFQADYMEALETGDFAGGLLETFQALQDYDAVPFFVGFELDETAIKEDLRTQFETLIADPTTFNLDAAAVVADELGDQGMKDRLEEVRAETADTRTATDLLTGAWADMTGKLQTLLPGFTDLETQGIEPTVDALGLLADDTTSYGEDLAGMLAIALVSWTDYVDRVNALELKPPSTTPPVTVDAQGFADGGVAPGNRWSAFGEQGMEFANPDTALAVLNNVSTEAIMAGVSAALHGGMGGGTTIINNYNNIALNNTNNNAAQRMGSDIRFLNQVRGSI